MKKEELRDEIRRKLFEDEQMESEDQIADAIIEELVATQTHEGDCGDKKFEFTEENVNMLRKAFMAGFLASNESFNGSSARAVYKDSAIKPGGVIWDEKLKRRFKRHVYNEKRRTRRND